MGWFTRHGKKKYDQYETFGTHTPKKSILRSSSRVNPNLNPLDDKSFDSDHMTSMSLVNLRSSSTSELTRKFESTNRLSHLNGHQSDGENDHFGRGNRTVLFLDQVAEPDRYRTSRVLDFDTEPGNCSTLSNRSPTFTRTISPSSSSSLASYPANYEPSPLIRKKNFNDPGIELVSCSPLPCSAINHNQQQQHLNSKLHKFRPAMKRLSYLNAFSKKRKDFKKSNLTLILDQESDNTDHINSSNEHGVHQYNKHNQMNEQTIYEELSRLDTLKLSSSTNDTNANGVHDIFCIPNYNEYYHQTNELSHIKDILDERNGSIITVDRLRSDAYQSENIFQPHQMKINPKYSYHNNNKKNLIKCHSSNRDQTPTGSTETLVESPRKLLSHASMGYTDGQNKVLSTGYSTTVQNPITYYNRMVDTTNKCDWKTVSIDQSEKHTANNNNNGVHGISPQTPRIIYVSKWKPVDEENSSKLTANHNKIISVSELSKPSTTSYDSDLNQIQTNQISHHIVTPNCKTRMVTIHYSDNDNL
ncbi:hypothetical protein EWB00_001480 [Schistosoma japonicum]|uniref:Uncharacterized protein n=2 Tax=Schistosoma japonicum TaxID=6182 RepID=A0A4Z2DFG8_SCHJA|nr:hypothetical protein EWB00_001480 [Schistosoma japonicum]